MVARHTTVVTGANRGIGLEFVRQCLRRGDRVVAAVRRVEEMERMRGDLTVQGGELEVVGVEMGEESSIKRMGEWLRAKVERVDNLIHNAGVGGGHRGGLAGFEGAPLMHALLVNLFGPLFLTRECLPLLEKDSRVGILTSRLGVLREGAGLGGAGMRVAYPASKAAVHRVIPVLAGELRERGVWVVGLDPGWVRTDMTAGADQTERYQLEPEESVQGMLEVLARLDGDSTGGLFRWNGEWCQWYAPPETPEELQLREK